MKKNIWLDGMMGLVVGDALGVPVQFMNRKVLILGAFGCGAFCNPPAVVAKAFKAVQEKYASYFEVIEYAVYCGGHETQNYDAFCKEFDVSKMIKE